jgi:uncharacterized protein DUF4333
LFRTRIISLAAIALLSACSFSIGSGNNLNTDKLETEVKNGIEEQTGATGVTVTCPDDVKIEKDNNFTCTAADNQGNSRNVDVTQTDDEGNVNWELGD